MLSVWTSGLVKHIGFHTQSNNIGGARSITKPHLVVLREMMGGYRVSAGSFVTRQDVKTS